MPAWKTSSSSIHTYLSSLDGHTVRRIQTKLPSPAPFKILFASWRCAAKFVTFFRPIVKPLKNLVIFYANFDCYMCQLFCPQTNGSCVCLWRDNGYDVWSGLCCTSRGIVYVSDFKDSLHKSAPFPLYPLRQLLHFQDDDNPFPLKPTLLWNNASRKFSFLIFFFFFLKTRCVCVERKKDFFFLIFQTRGQRGLKSTGILHSKF